VTSGSVIVPSPLFGEVAALRQRRPELEVGVHLTLTSESPTHRWEPLTDGAGLHDDDGFLWPSVADARRHATPEAVVEEIRAQLDTARRAGISIGHIDHHMGVAAAPEFVEHTAGVAIEYGIPMLLPDDIGRYYGALRVHDADPVPAWRVRRRLEEHGLLVGGEFAIGYIHQHQDCRTVYERLIGGARPGVTYLSLHCSAPGDIEDVHPTSARWRIAEYELFGSPEFAEWLGRSGVTLTAVRDLNR
jgi:predicted glycoside hydrolase/deacetylase ChbG (UPF0249 family)